MKINAKETIKNMDGEDAKGAEGVVLTVGMAIANVLLSAKEGGKMKMFVLAKKFWDDKMVEVDEADLSMIKIAVEKTDIYNTLVIGQLLLLLNSKNAQG